MEERQLIRLLQDRVRLVKAENAELEELGSVVASVVAPEGTLYAPDAFSRNEAQGSELAMSASKTLLFEVKTGEYIDSPQFMHHVALKLILHQNNDDNTVSGRMHYVERTLGCYHDLEFMHFSKGHKCTVTGEHLVTTERLFPLIVSRWLEADAVKSVAVSGGRKPVFAPAEELSGIVANENDPSVSMFKDMQFAIAPDPSALWDAPETCTLSFTQGGELQTNDLSFVLKLVDSIANDDDVFCNSPLL
jgi:hypothetical protein